MVVLGVGRGVVTLQPGMEMKGILICIVKTFKCSPVGLHYTSVPHCQNQGPRVRRHRGAARLAGKSRSVVVAVVHWRRPRGDHPATDVRHGRCVAGVHSRGGQVGVLGRRAAASPLSRSHCRSREPAGRPADGGDEEDVADEDAAVGHYLHEDQLQPEDVDTDVDGVLAEVCQRRLDRFEPLQNTGPCLRAEYRF